MNFDGEQNVRPKLRWFARKMERELAANDHKGGWLNDSPEALFSRLLQEAEELREALETGDHHDVIKEAADVANFAMMIADVGGIRNGVRTVYGERDEEMDEVESDGKHNRLGTRESQAAT